ncbi:MAG: hypothetical protein AB7P31_06215 [Steroidobacteraceae bacterium]
MKAVLLCSFGATLGLAACAGQPTTLHGVEAQAVERACVQSTGSRIRRANDECLPVAGRAYGRSDIVRRGANDVGQALAAMDPSISLGR